MGARRRKLTIIFNVHSHKVNVREILSPDGISRSPDETQFKSLEEKRAATMEMAQEKDEKKKKSAAAEKEVETPLVPLPGGGMG
ncbi:MAG: hypothetical protein JSV56_01335 [Methanomassiliicoccales archaeon]|nr:MAG: hypothetical protein JSV56_01335 [Methanomassiliicoccales archaeon]